MKSYIESLLESSIEVPCQTDSKYSSISSNQCSWCACEFLKRKSDLLKNYTENPKKFLEIYEECLLIGSKKRALNNKYHPEGDDIDEEHVVKEYDLKEYQFKNMMLNGDKIPIELLEMTEVAALKDLYFKVKYEEVKDFKFLKGEKGEFMLLCRHAQSFLILALGEDNYMILDSHVRNVGIVNRENMEKYAKFDEGGFTLIDIIHGKEE